MGLVKCKPCGYITDESKLGDVCPACGVSSKLFEPYKDKVSAKRRKLIDLDLHPIAVHFPQTIAVFIFQLIIVNMMFPSFKGYEITLLIQFLSILLPFAVFGAWISGIIDGKIRFKKLKTPALVKKIILGTSMLITSILVPIFALNYEFTISTKILILISSGVSLGIAIQLAVIGKKLMYAEMPGK